MSQDDPLPIAGALPEFLNRDGLNEPFDPDDEAGDDTCGALCTHCHPWLGFVREFAICTFIFFIIPWSVIAGVLGALDGMQYRAPAIFEHDTGSTCQRTVGNVPDGMTWDSRPCPKGYTKTQTWGVSFSVPLNQELNQDSYLARFVKWNPVYQAWFEITRPR